MTGPPFPTPGPGGEITLVEGTSFCISESNGDVLPATSHGLFVRDVRVLSTWTLRIDGHRLHPLVAERIDPYAARFGSVCRAAAAHPQGSLLALRSRYVGDGMREDVTIRNMSARAERVVVSIVFDADFADLFEVKSGAAGGIVEVSSRLAPDGVELASGRGARTLQTVVHATRRGTWGAREVSWAVALAPHGEWSTTVQVRVGHDGVLLEPHHRPGEPTGQSVPARRLRDWRARGPRVVTGDARLTRALSRAVDDIGVLRIFDPVHAERPAVAAGAPWFMALFGRDSLLTSWMLLPLDAGLAVGTMTTLAELQGRRVDPATEEEPGRIPHEVRYGSAQLLPDGRPVYYGTADATPLFVALAGELVRWGHLAAVTPLLEHVDRALAWMQGPGDRDGDGFVEYQQ